MHDILRTMDNVADPEETKSTQVRDVNAYAKNPGSHLT